MKNLIFGGLATFAAAQMPPGAVPPGAATMPADMQKKLAENQGVAVVAVDYDENWHNVPKNKIKRKIEDRPVNVLVMGY